MGRRGIACAALFLCLSPASADQLCATRLDTDALLACLTVNEGQRWSVVWNHSVEGFEVEDIYENRDGHMVLIRSHQPDFAAGLGHIIGRGQQISDGNGGYWIEGINEPVPGDAYILRPGRRPVNHRLRTETSEISLSALAERQRVRIALLAESAP